MDSQEIALVVSIVTYKTEHNMIQRCIDSIKQAKLNIQIMIIDNSPNNELESFCCDYNVIYHHLANNVGYGTAHNVAIRYSIENNIPYHLILNPDVYFQADVLEKLYQVCQQDSSIGLIIPKVLYPDNTLQYCCRLIPSFADLFIRRFISKLGRKTQQINELRFTNYNIIMEVPFISGCFMFCRTKALETIGMFDERFFLYMEDLDLSRRMWKKYKNVFYPHVHIYHDCQKSSYSLNKAFIYHMCSAIKYFFKWGFLFDSERKQINQTALNKINLTL
jgi:hypothetical protein